jgi:hypothetical protein
MRFQEIQWQTNACAVCRSPSLQKTPGGIPAYAVTNVKAMKPESTASRQMIRFSVDAGNTVAEIQTVLAAVKKTTGMLRA